MNDDELRAAARKASDDPEVREVLTRLRERIAEAVADALGDLHALGVDDTDSPTLMAALAKFRTFAEADRRSEARRDELDAHLWQVRQEARGQMRLAMWRGLQRGYQR